MIHIDRLLSKDDIICYRFEFPGLVHSYYIESIHLRWRRLAPSILKTSYCKFYGTHFIPTHDKPSIWLQFAHYSKSVPPFLIQPYKFLTKIYAVIIFSSFHFHHTLFSWAFVGLCELFSISQSVHTFVCLITHLFLIRLQPNLNQHFSYVWSTSKITFSLEQAPDCI